MSFSLSGFLSLQNAISFLRKYIAHSRQIAIVVPLLTLPHRLRSPLRWPWRLALCCCRCYCIPTTFIAQELTASTSSFQASTSGEAQVVLNGGAESVSSSSCAAGKKRTLEELTWDHSFIRELPRDSQTGDSVRQVWLKKRFLGAVHTSEWFNTADCSIKTGLIATVIVSQEFCRVLCQLVDSHFKRNAIGSPLRGDGWREREKNLKCGGSRMLVADYKCITPMSLTECCGGLSPKSPLSLPPLIEDPLKRVEARLQFTTKEKFYAAIEPWRKSI